MTTTPRIVILGAGFSGLTAARELERLAGSCLEVVLVDRHNYFLFSPLLAEAATGSVGAAHVAAPLRRFFRSAVTRRGEVMEIDPAERRVVVDLRTAFEPRRLELGYDQLVVALGSRTSSFGLPGVAEHAFTLGSLADAFRLRNRILHALERADGEPEPERRRALLTFLVGGGSYTGVEVAAAVADYLRHALPEYPHVDEADVRVILAEAKARLLPELSARLGELARTALAAKGVEVLTATAVESAEADRVVLQGLGAVETRTFVWAAGIEPTTLLRDAPLEQDDSGWLRADADLRAERRRDVWVAGDCATIADGRGGRYPATAQHAVRQGEAVATNVLRTLAGKPTEPLRYQSPGVLIGLGHRTALAELQGRTLAGLPAWLLWRAFYLARMPSLSRRARVGADWLVSGLAGPDLAELPLGRTDAFERPREPAAPRHGR